MSRPRFYIGDSILLLLLLAPILESWQSIFSLGSLSLVLAKVFGILGLAMILLAGSMSVRLPKLDRYFGGLLRMWTIHHYLAAFGFLFVMLHVWLLVITHVPTSLNLTIIKLFPPLTDWPTWLGWLGFIFLSIFLAPSFKFFGEMNYQRWKSLHMLSAPALAFSLLHTIPMTTEYISWAVLTLLTLCAIVWRKVLSPKYARQSYIVESKIALASDVVELGLKPNHVKIDFNPGQFVYLTPMDTTLSAGYNEEHPYTISSAPTEDLLKIGIKNLGDATHALQSIKIGSEVKIEGPYGSFLNRYSKKRSQLWFGGGIGVTPFISAIRDPNCRKAHLFYLADTKDRAYYLEEIYSYANAEKQVFATEHYFKHEGPISIDFIQRHCPDFADREVYICGPKIMIDHLIHILTNAGIKKTLIHTEVFELL